MTTIGERVDKVISTLDHELEETRRCLLNFPQYDRDGEIIESLNKARAEFISAVEALIERYQI